MSLDRAFKVSDHILTRQIDNETVIMDMERSVYCGLNEVGTRIFELIKDEKTLAEITDVIMTEYDLSLIHISEPTRPY